MTPEAREEFDKQCAEETGRRKSKALMERRGPLPSVLQAASRPRPGDGISSNWLIAELTHRQAHGLKLI